MGHDTYVLRTDARRDNWVAGENLADDTFAPLPECSPSDLAARPDVGDVQLVDLNSSMRFREVHLSGARWSIRPRLPALRLDPAVPVVIACDAPGIAALAAKDMRDVGCADIRRLSGTAMDWRAAGLACEASPGEPADRDAIDYLFFVHDRHDGNLQAARDYLSWEQGLVAQLDADERAMFRL